MVRAHVFAFAHLCVSVCACVFMCSCICSRTTVSLPPGFLCCFVLFHFVFLLSLQETNTGSLCPLLDLPSVPGDQVGGQMLCRNARPSSGSRASVSPHCWTEVACGVLFVCLFLPWSRTRTWSSVLSSSCRLFSFMEPREMATETWSLDTQPCRLWLEKLSA